MPKMKLTKENMLLIAKPESGQVMQLGETTARRKSPSKDTDKAGNHNHSRHL